MHAHSRFPRRGSASPLAAFSIGAFLLVGMQPVCSPDSVTPGASLGPQVVNQTGRELTAEELAQIEQNTSNADIVLVMLAPSFVAGSQTPASTNPPPSDPNSAEFVARHALIGEVRMYAGRLDEIPVGWVVCDGRELPRDVEHRLFNRVGTMYGGGDGATTFNVPDYRNRSPMGADGFGANGNPATSVEGFASATGGKALHSLTVHEMPSHVHDITHDHTVDATYYNSGTTVLSLGGVGTPTQVATSIFQGSSGATGGNTPFSICHPYFAVGYIIFTGNVGPLPAQ